MTIFRTSSPCRQQRGPHRAGRALLAPLLALLLGHPVQAFASFDVRGSAALADPVLDLVERRGRGEDNGGTGDGSRPSGDNGSGSSSSSSSGSSADERKTVRPKSGGDDKPIGR